MIFEKKQIDCQDPLNDRYANRVFTIVQCLLEKSSNIYNNYYELAVSLADKVNNAAANDSAISRPPERVILDSFGGVLAEKSWENYINSIFGNIASPTPFTSASNQIDIQLKNGELIEVRSSFPRNGVRFALCSDRYNFRNIGPYSNSVKSKEIQKHIYAAVLFDTKKTDLLETDAIDFSLVGGSTWQMMLSLGYDTNLNARNEENLLPGTYKVIGFKDALDVEQIENEIQKLGYNKVNKA